MGYGSSGGGVFQVRTGRLLGIVEGYRTATVSLKLAGEPYSFQVPMPGETFVVRAAEIRRFLGERGFAACWPTEPLRRRPRQASLTSPTSAGSSAAVSLVRGSFTTTVLPRPAALKVSKLPP